jgi:ferredoxin-NADP reductase
MDDARMPAMLVSHRRPGFYFRVIEEGTVQAGDDIAQIATGPEAMTVAEIDALLYLPGHPRQKVRRALRIPALSAGWRASFEAIGNEKQTPEAGAGNAGLVAVSPPPAWPGFSKLAVTAVSRESESVVSVGLSEPDGHAVPAALPGQFVTLRMPVSKDAPPVLRSYSLSGAPGDSSYQISVKLEPNGTGSRFVHACVVGDQVEVAAPRGTFILQPGATPVLLISAGVGATPVMSMLRALAADQSGREIWWLHGSRSRSDEPFASESESLVAGLSHGHRLICYSRPGADDVTGDDYRSGRLTAAVLTELGLPRDADAYICGPAGFMADASAALVGIGLDGARVHTEIFGTAPSQTPGIAAATARPPHKPAGEPGSGPQVAFARSGLDVRWDPDYASLLELAEACDVPVRWSCRTGVCHTCESGLMAGAVRYSPDPVDDPAAGNVLICCSQPSQDVVLDL